MKQTQYYFSSVNASYNAIIDCGNCSRCARRGQGGAGRGEGGGENRSDPALLRCLQALPRAETDQHQPSWWPRSRCAASVRLLATAEGDTLYPARAAPRRPPLPPPRTCPLHAAALP